MYVGLYVGIRDVYVSVWCCDSCMLSSSVHSLFSYRVGLPLHNAPVPEVLMKNIEAAFYHRMLYLNVFVENLDIHVNRCKK